MRLRSLKKRKIWWLEKLSELTLEKDFIVELQVNTIEVSLITTVFKEALLLYPKPKIFNTDQVPQYTVKE